MYNGSLPVNFVGPFRCQVLRLFGGSADPQDFCSLVSLGLTSQITGNTGRWERDQVGSEGEGPAPLSMEVVIPALQASASGGSSSRPGCLVPVPCW